MKETTKETKKKIKKSPEMKSFYSIIEIGKKKDPKRAGGNMRNMKNKEERKEERMGKIKTTFENFGRRTKAKWKTVAKLSDIQQEFVEELIYENEHYIIESPQNFDRSAAYIYITETEDDQHYVVRVSENWSIAGTCDWDTDKEATLLKILAGKKLEVRYCKLDEFEHLDG